MDDAYLPLTITVEDIQTGERRTQKTPFNAHWWTEGNGSCDCNRHLTFFPEHDPPAGIDGKPFPEGFCFGCKRYRIVAVEPIPEDYMLADFNDGYE